MAKSKSLAVQITVRQNGNGEICNSILRSLPKWFGIESAIVDYVKSVPTMPMLVAHLGGHENVGFLSLHFHNEFSAEIYVMAIRSEFHKKGIGKSLVREAERFVRARKGKFLTLKTLSPSRPSPEYKLTHRFYESVGFVPLEEFKTLWDESNPCLLMIKTV